MEGTETLCPHATISNHRWFARDSSRLLSIKPNEWMHLSPFYTRMHGEWLRYAKSTRQFHWRFLFSQRWSGLPSKCPMSSRHNVSVPSIRSQEEEMLMCRLQHCICVSRPCEILGDVNAEELKAAHPLHRCLVDGDGDGCVFSALSPVIHHQLLGLVDVEWEVVLLTPFSQGTHLLSVGRLIVVGDQAYHRCVISKFDDDIGAVCSCTVMCVQGVQEWAEDAALRCTSVEGQRRWCVVAHSDHLTSAWQEVQDPAAQRSVQS